MFETTEHFLQVARLLTLFQRCDPTLRNFFPSPCRADLGIVPWVRRFSAFVCAAEDFVGSVRRRLLAVSGLGWSPRVLPYRGFGTEKQIRVLARLVEDRGVLSPNLERGWWGGVRASFHRFNTAELPTEPVELRLGDVTCDAVSDPEGFVDHVWELPEPLAAGWHRVEIQVKGYSAPPATTDLPVLVSKAPAFGVILDIDDTLIDSRITDRKARARAMFLGEATARRPFSDAAELCRALTGVEARRPIHYLSSSPWNLYDHLEHFFDVHGFPQGPVLLRDWGFSQEGFAPDGRHDHKLDKLQDILALYPKLPFVLVGDSSQEDPVHYLSLAEAMPGRVKAVLIRKVFTKPDKLVRLDRIVERFGEIGVPCVVFTEARAALELIESWDG